MPLVIYAFYLPSRRDGKDLEITHDCYSMVMIWMIKKKTPTIYFRFFNKCYTSYTAHQTLKYGLQYFESECFEMNKLFKLHICPNTAKNHTSPILAFLADNQLTTNQLHPIGCTGGLCLSVCPVSLSRKNRIWFRQLRYPSASSYL